MSSQPSSGDLHDLRRHIDEIDRAILRLIGERRNCSFQIGEAKKTGGVPALRDAAREFEILTRLSHEGLERGIPPTLTQSVFGALISDSLARQEQDILRSSETIGRNTPKRTGFLTRDGLWGEQAAAQCASFHEKTLSNNVTQQPVSNSQSILQWASLAEATQALHKGNAELLVLPIEHSNLGTLRESMIAIIDAGLRVVREVRVPVALALMAPTGVTLNQIRRLYGSELAFRLCSSLLETLGSVSQEIASFVGEERIRPLQGEDEISSNDWAIVAPEHLAITSGLTVIAPSVSDFPQTTLRFFACALTPEPITNQLSYATSLLAGSQQASGSLSSILDIFRRRNIVLTKLESLGTLRGEVVYQRMSSAGSLNPSIKSQALRGYSEGPHDEFFYIECLGAETLSPLSEALSELSAIGALVEILGSYPKMSQPPQPGVVWEKQ